MNDSGLSRRVLHAFVYRSEDGGETWKYMNRYNNRPFYYSQIYINPHDDKLVYAMGTRVQVSEDGGKTFREGMPGISGDFHAMWIDAHNKDRYYSSPWMMEHPGID